MLWRVLRSTFRLDGDRVVLPSSVQAELRWWAIHLRHSELGVPLASIRMPPVGPDCAAVYADASGSVGFAAWTVICGELLVTAGVWTDEEKELLTIAELELLASTFGVVAFDEWLPRAVVSFTDNVVAQAAMRASAPRAELMQRVVVARTEWLMQRGMAEAVRRVTSQANLWADLGSRGELMEVVRQAEALDLVVREVEVPVAWRDTAAWLLTHGRLGS